MSIEYTIVFEEPWRVGSGEAAGWTLDAAVRKDPDGLPFVPGSTLRGRVGDALRQLAPLLDLELCDGTLAPPAAQGASKGESGSQGSERPMGRLCGVNHGLGDERRVDYCACCRLLGSPRIEGALGWGPARLRPNDPDWDKNLAPLAASIPGHLTRLRNRTAIDGRSGRAEDEHLFTLEEVRGGLELGARLDLHQPLDRDLLALLLAAMRHVRELGGGRRRGLGACRLRIETPHLHPAFDSWREAIEHLRNLDEGASATTLFPQPEPVSDSPLARVVPHSSSGQGADPNRPVTLKLDARVVGEVALGGRPESGNLIRGLPFLPGSTLRGALAGRWRHDKGSEAFHHCFVSGAIRFGYLHPLENQRCAQPTPLSAHTCKLRPGHREDGGHGVVDTLAEPGMERCPRDGCGAVLVPWQPQFEGRAPALELSSHNRIDPSSQTVRRGSLFAYETLAHGARLRGFLAAERGEDLDRLLTGLGLGGLEQLAGDARLTLRVGRRKGALGHLECGVSQPSTKAGDVGLFPDAPATPEPQRAPCDVRIDLLTPALLVDDHLRYRDLEPGDLGIERAFDGVMSRSERLAGWHGMHGLPKTEELALAAGSCWLLRHATSEELVVLRQAAWQGVGRRRAEGFGAIAITSIENRSNEEIPS